MRLIELIRYNKKKKKKGQKEEKVELFSNLDTI